MFTVLTCGARNYSDREKIENALSDLCDRRGPWVDQESFGTKFKTASGVRVVNGGTANADVYAITWACENGAQWQEYRPEAKYGIGASAVRDQDYFVREKIDCVLTFGTGSDIDNVARLARKERIEVKAFK